METALTQNIVTNLCEESRKGLTEELREFIQSDNHGALEAGHSSEGPLKCEGRQDQKVAQR